MKGAHINLKIKEGALALHFFNPAPIYRLWCGRYPKFKFVNYSPAAISSAAIPITNLWVVLPLPGPLVITSEPK